MFESWTLKLVEAIFPFDSKELKMSVPDQNEYCVCVS